MLFNCVVLLQTTALIQTVVFAFKIIPSSFPRVHTSKGGLVGTIVQTSRDNVGFAFQGVPYGEAPTGSNRFLKAQTKKPWQGYRQADKNGPECISENLFHREISEDCLSLDVYVPVQNFSKSQSPTYAVMLYCFGGNWEFGSPNDYAPAYLVDHFVSRDVIVVIPNYRTNIFGLFTTGNDVVPGNAGLHDIILALQWVHDEIANFGGDPSRVTIQGESSGGNAASCVAISPLSDGLISQALLMSGSVFDNEDTEYPDLDLNRDIANRVGCNDGQKWENGSFAKVISCMQEKDYQVLMDAYEVVKTTTLADPFGRGGQRTPGKPVVDGPGGVLPTGFAEMARSRRPLKAAMTGTLIREIYIDLGENATSQVVKLACGPISKLQGTDYADVVQKACEIYYVDRFAQSHSDDDRVFWNSQMNALMNDNNFFAPSLREAISLINTGTPQVYAYSFEYPKDGTPPEAGPNHAQDLMYIFGFPPYFPPDSFTARDAAMGDIYADFLCNFIKFGTPTPPEENGKYPDWNPISNNRQLDYYHLNVTEQSMDKYYRDSAYEFYIEILPPLMQVAKNGENTTLKIQQLMEIISVKSAASSRSSNSFDNKLLFVFIGIVASLAIISGVVSIVWARQYRKRNVISRLSEETTRLLASSEA